MVILICLHVLVLPVKHATVILHSVMEDSERTTRLPLAASIPLYIQCVHRSFLVTNRSCCNQIYLHAWLSITNTTYTIDIHAQTYVCTVTVSGNLVLREP